MKCIPEGVKKAFYGCYNDTDNIADVECSKLQQPQSPLDQPCFLAACPPKYAHFISFICFKNENFEFGMCYQSRSDADL